MVENLIHWEILVCVHDLPFDVAHRVEKFEEEMIGQDIVPEDDSDFWNFLQEEFSFGYEIVVETPLWLGKV